MSEVLAALQRFLATVHRFNEAALLVEIPRHDFLNQLVGVAALLSGRSREFRFEFGREVHLQVFRLREKRRSGKLQVGHNVAASRA
jgi:hypothetical protein